MQPTPPRTRLDRIVHVARACGFLALSLAALCLAIGVVAAVAMARNGDITNGNEHQATFSTTASGTVEVPPSMATTSVRMRACGTGPSTALQTLNARFAGMRRAWREGDVPDADITRGNVQTNRETPKWWCSELNAVATVEDLDLVDEVLAGIAQHPKGIQAINGPTFDYDPAKLEEGALDEAMRVARRKADDAAKRAGSRVTGVRSLEEHEVSVSRPDEFGVGYDRDMLMGTSTVAVSATVKSMATAVSQASGEATATVSVSAVFELE